MLFVDSSETLLWAVTIMRFEERRFSIDGRSSPPGDVMLNYHGRRGDRRSGPLLRYFSTSLVGATPTLPGVLCRVNERRPSRRRPWLRCTEASAVQPYLLTRYSTIQGSLYLATDL